jgi:hypothetical protein
MPAPRDVRFTKKQVTFQAGWASPVGIALDRWSFGKVSRGATEHQPTGSPSAYANRPTGVPEAMVESILSRFCSLDIWWASRSR